MKNPLDGPQMWSFLLKPWNISVKVLVDRFPRWKIFMVHNTFDVKKHNIVFTLDTDISDFFGRGDVIVVHWRLCVLVVGS